MVRVNIESYRRGTGPSAAVSPPLMTDNISSSLANIANKVSSSSIAQERAELASALPGKAVANVITDVAKAEAQRQIALDNAQVSTASVRFENDMMVLADETVKGYTGSKGEMESSMSSFANRYEVLKGQYSNEMRSDWATTGFNRMAEAVYLKQQRRLSKGLYNRDTDINISRVNQTLRDTIAKGGFGTVEDFNESKQQIERIFDANSFLFKDPLAKKEQAIKDISSRFIMQNIQEDPTSTMVALESKEFKKVFSPDELKSLKQESMQAYVSKTKQDSVIAVANATLSNENVGSMIKEGNYTDARKSLVDEIENIQQQYDILRNQPMIMATEDMKKDRETLLKSYENAIVAKRKTVSGLNTAFGLKSDVVLENQLLSEQTSILMGIPVEKFVDKEGILDLEKVAKYATKSKAVDDLEFMASVSAFQRKAAEAFSSGMISKSAYAKIVSTGEPYNAVMDILKNTDSKKEGIGSLVSSFSPFARAPLAVGTMGMSESIAFSEGMLDARRERGNAMILFSSVVGRSTTLSDEEKTSYMNKMFNRFIDVYNAEKSKKSGSGEVLSTTEIKNMAQNVMLSVIREYNKDFNPELYSSNTPNKEK